MKKDLRLAYSHGNIDCYPLDPEGMAHLAATQYRMSVPRDPNKGPQNGKKGDINGNKEDDEHPDSSKNKNN